MKLTIDGQLYEFDTDWLVEMMDAQNRKYLDPESPTAKKYTMERLGVKALLRPKQNKLLQIIAEALGIEDWHSLQPGKHGDILLTLSDLYRQLCLAQFQNTTLELETAHNEQHGHLLGSDAGVKLEITGATIGTRHLTAEPARQKLTWDDSDDGQSATTLGPETGAAGLVALQVPSKVY